MKARRPRLEGKVAIVTGAGSSGPGVGTGKAASILFAREGASVLLVDVNPQAAEVTLATIREEGGVASVFEGDVSNAADCEAMVEATVERYGKLDVLFNNAGILAGRPSSVLEVSEEDWDRVMAVNLKSIMLTAKYAIPRMVEAGGGSIINVSSASALRAAGPNDVVAYSTSKGGIITMTTTMAVHYGKDNIRVNCISPGHIHTPMVAADMTEDWRNLRRLSCPLGVGKEGTAWDVAWAVVFLASDESTWITGVNLSVDGGLMATTPLSMLHYLK